MTDYGSMHRTQVRISTSEGESVLQNVVAACKLDGYIFLIYPTPEGEYNATYAPVGKGTGPYQTIEQTVAALDCHKGKIGAAIERALRDMYQLHMPLLSAETGIETSDWQWRERCRFESGEYKSVPKIDGREYPTEHYLHLSVTKTESDYVSYTPSETYGLADRQVRLKFGKYLRKTFESLTDADIQREVTAFRAKLALADSPPTLMFTTERSVINDIFETEMYPCDCSMASCMYGKFKDRHDRPYHVYADSPDVAVAYVLERDQIVSRSVVSTKDKVWIRCYSVESNGSTRCKVLVDMLEARGYKKGSLTGNRLTRVTHRGDITLPYIDCGGMDVSYGDGYWIVVKSGGEYTADCTDGTATENVTRCERCDNDEDQCSCIYCECCDESYADGCGECSMCPECDGCIDHDQCSCTRCEECHEIINPRHRSTTECDCERCEDCHELTEECDCEPETQPETQSETEVAR
jgi:hypothetical protein